MEELLVRPDRNNKMRNAVVFATNKKCFQLARHAATSFILTQTQFQDVYIFCHTLLPNPKDRLIDVGEEHGIRVHMEPISDPYFEKLHSSGYLKKIVQHLKLKSLETISHAYDRVLFVDCDILFYDQISLDKVDLEGFPIGAAYDIAVTSEITGPDFLQNCRLNNRSPHYFNSGFMLFDCAKWDGNSREKYIELLNKHQMNCDYLGECPHNDQCIYNLLFENNWKKLPLNFNMQACAKFTDRWKEASVRHYQGDNKFLPARPWRADSREILLMRRIREALGYNDPPPLPLSVMFKLNRLRNKRNPERTNKAIARLEQMDSHPNAGL